MRTTEEWLLAFNQYYQNITSNKAPGLEPYEISLFLTDAQRAVVLGICNGSLGEPFESNEQVMNYLAPLVRQAKIQEPETDEALPRIAGSKSYIYELPEDMMFRTYEFCVISDSRCGDMNAAVIPVTQDEYWRTSRDPFKRQNSRKVLRLVYADSEYKSVVPQSVGSGSGSADGLQWKKYSEIVSDTKPKSYNVRYIKYPEPIILEDLTSSGLSIEGKQSPSVCLLDESLHNAILVKAVQIAQSVWSA